MFTPIPTDFAWSFSKLSTYAHCPKCFMLQQMQTPKLPEQQNAFAEYGLLCHTLLEQYAKGNLEDFELADRYAKYYTGYVEHPFPPYPKDYSEKTYREGLNYFQTFTGFGNDMEIVSVEDKFELTLGSSRFHGIADLVLRNTADGTYHVIDHKTKSAASMKKDRAMYTRQLYLYALYVKERFGIYPSTLRFNLIKTRSEIIEPFSEEALRETCAWMEDTIDAIYLDSDFEPTPSKYYCEYICPVINYCREGIDICTGRMKGV